MPPPAVLREFDALVPGGAERIFLQFETEASHRRATETTIIEIQRQQIAADGKRNDRGQWLAALFSVLALATASYALYCGQTTAAIAIGGGSIAMVVTAFLGPKLLARREAAED